MIFQLFILVVLMMILTYNIKPVTKKVASSTRAKRNTSPPFGDVRTGSFGGKQAPPRNGNHIIDKGGMTRCHNCSTFFPAGNVVHEIIQGHILEFCSSKCRDSFVHGT